MCFLVERQWRKSRLEIHRQLFVKQKSTVNKLIEKEKKTYFVNKIQECGDDQKKLFDIIEHLLHRKAKEALPDHTSELELAKQFNTFFIDKITAIRDDLDIKAELLTNKNHVSNYSPQIHSVLSNFQIVEEEEIIKTIKSMSSATCELDPIPTKFVKDECLETLVPAIATIVNDSLSTGVFPSSFKNALVKPLLKKPSLDNNILKNYRPVSNLSFVSKLIEKCVIKQLQEHLEQNNLTEAYQSAYRSGHSTETALLRVSNDIVSAVDDGKAACLVLLDLSAAFDTIDHQTLFTSLHDLLGVRGVVLNWFSSYLSNRYQIVKINDTKSERVKLSYGVPQGSVLGPFLFCIYLLPLSHIIRKHGMELHIYADDTQLYCFFNVKSPQEAEAATKKITSCVADIQCWMTDVRLKLNDDKTEFLVISSPYHDQPKLSFNLGQVNISASTSCRNLGVIFDSHLNFKSHISVVCKNSFFHLRNIGAIRKFLTTDACEKLIHAFVTSKLDYCNSLLVNIPKCDIAKLQKVQNVAARIVTKTDKFEHITPVIMELHWLPVALRIIYKLLLLTYKCLHDEGPSYLKDLVTYYQPPVCLRSSNQKLLRSRKYKLETYGKRGFCYAAPMYWNTIPYGIRAAQSTSVFKKDLKTHLMKKFVEKPDCYI